MLIIGAKGHAKEIIEILVQIDRRLRILFYDDISTDLPELLYNKYKIIRSVDEANNEFKRDARFVLGLGNPYLRYKMAMKFISLGGKLESVISPYSRIGSFNVNLENGLNIMSGVFISNDVSIGEGSLLNTYSTIHHDTKIGKYCEISSGAHITGSCVIGDFCSIGTGAVILPKITIGDNVVVGAGAVVNSNVEDNAVVVGVPARKIKENKPLRM